MNPGSHFMAVGVAVIKDWLLMFISIPFSDR